MASHGGTQPRSRDCSQTVIRIRTPDGRVHTLSGKDKVKEFERRKEEETKKLKAELAIKNLQVVCQSRQAEVTWEPCEVSPCQYRVTLQPTGAKSGKEVYKGEVSQCEVDKLHPGQSYSLIVVASQDPVQGESSYANFIVLPEPPGRPRPPKVTTKSKSAITLKWSGPENNGSPITYYILEWDQGDPERQGGFIELYAGGETQFKLTHRLDPSLKFHFRLKAQNGIGWSEWSEIFTFHTGVAVPGKPPPPAVTAVGVTYLEVQWEGTKSCGGHVTTYKLEMEDCSSGYGFQTAYQGEDCHWTQHDLFRNSCYRFRLCVVNERGAGPHSEVVEERTRPDKPGPPVQLCSPLIKSRHIVIEWAPPADDGGTPVTGFVVELCGGSERRLLEREEPLVDIPDLTPGTAYEVRIAAKSGSGQGEWSKMHKVTTSVEQPSEPLAVAIVGFPRQHSIALCWDPPSSSGGAPIVHYTIECCTETLPWKVVGVVSGDAFRSHDQSHDQSLSLSHTVGNLTPGCTYRLRVKCQNSCGDSPWSQEVQCSTAPGTPGLPETVSVTLRGPTSAVVQCQCRDDFGSCVVSYNLRYWGPGEAEAKQHKEVASVGDMVTITGLLPAHEYYYCLQAVNAVGVGRWGVAASFSTPPSSPSQVGMFKVVGRSTCTVTVAWATPADNGSLISSYHIECGNKTISVEGTQTEVTVDDLSPDTAYRVRCQAENRVGRGPLSAPLTVKTLPPPPTPPTLSLMSATATALKVSWDKKPKKPPSELTYKLELLREGAPGLLVYQGTGHSFKLGNLTPNQSYQLRLAAASEAGEGPWGLPVTFTTLPALPGTPRGFTVSCDPLPVAFSWQPSLGGQEGGKFHYEVQLSVAGRGKEFTQICSTRDVSCSYKGCQPGCSYAARVRVVGEEPVAYGRFTDPVQFSVPSVPAMEEDLALPKPAEPLQDHSTSSAVSTLQTLVPQRFLVPVLFLLLSVLVVLLAFAVGVFFQF